MTTDPNLRDVAAGASEKLMFALNEFDEALKEYRGRLLLANAEFQRSLNQWMDRHDPDVIALVLSVHQKKQLGAPAAFETVWQALPKARG